MIFPNVEENLGATEVVVDLPHDIYLGKVPVAEHIYSHPAEISSPKRWHSSVIPERALGGNSIHGHPQIPQFAPHSQEEERWRTRKHVARRLPRYAMWIVATTADWRG